MPVEFLDAINIIKGEIAGDEMLWETQAINPKTGKRETGMWKSQYKKWTGVKSGEERRGG